MIIIGEKINGAIPRMAEAIRGRDEAYILQLVRLQEKCGADYLDVCAGTAPSEEYNVLCWLIDLVQSVAAKPICIDSPDPRMIERVFPKLKKPGIINSISGEGEKNEVLLPLLRDNPDWQVIALCCNNSGVPVAAEDKTRIALEIIETAQSYGIAPERMHIDPLVLALSAVNDTALQFCEAIRRIKECFPSVNVAAAVSNVSFGMPARNLINRNFLTMTMLAGLDTIIADPTNRDITGNVFATESLMGRDRYCRSYNKAYRDGRIGAVK